MLAGSFNDWNPNTLAMKKTDSGWIRELKLDPGKYWYKFIVDGEWQADGNNQAKENDGFGNINSVLFVTNADFFLGGFSKAKNVSLAGSFNQWRAKELIMMQTDAGWALSLYLADGTHTYKFVADGQWLADASNKKQVSDGNGGFNSVIALGKSYTFKLNGYENAKEVRLAGSFNNWRDFELPMKKSENGWETFYVLGSGNYEYKFLVDGKFIADPSNPSLTNNGNSLLIINANYTFRLKGYENAKRVVIAGDFNKWNPESFVMHREGNEWVFPAHLSVGKHLYKFIVDGTWIIDPNNKLWEQNEYGTGNSILWIDK
jgi:1,4-alpha-glucan branching enzyme